MRQLFRFFRGLVPLFGALAWVPSAHAGAAPHQAGSADSAPATGVGGTLVILGGAVKDGNDVLWETIVQAAGGPGALVLVLPTASGAPVETAEHTARQLQRRGARTEVLPIAPHWPGSDATQALAHAHDAQWVARVNAAQGLFMTGGDQDRLMATLRPQGQDTPLLRALRALHARGGVVAGTSAGAAVMSECAIRGLDDPFDALLRPLNADELGAGFGLLPGHVVADQHFLRRGRVARLLRVLLQSGQTLGMGVEEDSAAVVRGGVAQALGARGLLMLDTRGAVVRQQAPLAVDGVRLSYVDRGDRFDLHTRRLLPPATRRPLPPGPAEGTPGFFGDILGDNILVGAMAQAAEGPGRAARGLAWRLPQAQAFEWQLGSDSSTQAWGGRTRDDHSIEALALSVRPVRLAQPVYTSPDTPAPPPAPRP